MELPEKPGSLEHVESSFEADNRMFTKTPPLLHALPFCVAFPAVRVPPGDQTLQGDPWIYLWVEF